MSTLDDTIGQRNLAERAAQKVVDDNRLTQADGEPAVQALGWAMGTELSYEAAQTQLVDAARELSASADLVLVPKARLIGLVESAIELIDEHKLDYPQDYDAEGLAALRAESAELSALLETLI